MKFMVPGAFDTSRRFELESIGRLPEKSRVVLAVPAWLADALRPHPVEVKYDTESQMPTFHCTRPACIGSAARCLHARSRAECVLQVRLPERGRRCHCDFAIRQLYKNKEVGRITWRFVSEKYERRKL